MRIPLQHLLAIVAAIAGLVACNGGDGSDRAGGLRDVMFVANAEGGTVSALDAASFMLLREYDVLPDGPSPELSEDPEQALIGQRLVEAAGGANYAQDLDVAPDGRTLYVSRGHRGDVAAFDIASGDLLWRLAIAGLRADHMTLSQDGRFLYVSAMTDNRVQVIDTRQPAIIGSFASGQWPHDNHLSPDQQRLYNASIGNILVPEEIRAAQPAALDALLGAPYQITVVDSQSLAVLRTLRLGSGIRPFEITHDERRLYAQLSRYSGVVEFDLETGRISRRLDLPVADGVSDADYDFEAPHHGLALSHDESTLCLAGRISDYVALVATDSFTPLAIIPVGDAPGWASTTPDGRYCFVPNNRDDTVSVVSYGRRVEVARVSVGDGPKFITPAQVPEAAICPGGCSR